MRHSLIALIVVACSAVNVRAQQAMIVNQLEPGMTVTTQGCVKAAELRNEYVFTQVMTWPIARAAEGPYGPRHFSIHNNVGDLAQFVGDTLQLTGRIRAIKRSEIELEPGLNRYGTFVEFEGPSHNVLVRPQEIGLQLDRRAKRDDISITLLDYEVENIMRVMHGCLVQPAAAALTARRR